MKKLMSLLLASSLAALVGCSSNQSSQPASQAQPQTDTKPQTGSPKQVKTMKYGSGTPKDDPKTQGAIKFAELVEKKSGGAIKVEVYTDGTLGGDNQVVDGMRAGTIEAGNVGNAPLAAYAKRFSVFDLPFLFKDEKTAYTVLDGPLGKEVLKDLDKNKIVGLGYMENGYRHMTNIKKEIKSVADLKGMKIRTQPNPMQIDIWNTLGAVATPLAWNELFNALEQKVVDGQENTLSSMTHSKFYEVQKYLTDLGGYMYSPSVMMVSKKFWDTLTEEEKQIVQKSADEAIQYERELNRKDNEESLKVLKEHGMTITALSPEAQQEFAQKLQPVYEKYKAELGADFVQKLQEAAK